MTTNNGSQDSQDRDQEIDFDAWDYLLDAQEDQDRPLDDQEAEQWADLLNFED